MNTSAAKPALALFLGLVIGACSSLGSAPSAGTGSLAFNVALVLHTDGAPWGSSSLTINAVIRGARAGAIQGDGPVSGTELLPKPGSPCHSAAINGTATVIGQIVGDNLSVTGTVIDPPRLDAGILVGEAPLTGGTTQQKRPPDLAPGQTAVGANCYSYSTITQTLTVTPVAP